MAENVELRKTLIRVVQQKRGKCACGGYSRIGGDVDYGKEIKMNTVVAVVKGWEWICPKCDCLNEVEEISGGYTTDKCDGCDEEFEVYES